MVTRVSTVAFEGIDARPVDVQVQIAPGNVAFMIVGLADKAVAESRERVRSALIASGLALPAKRITVNLAPADLPKEGYQNVGISRACTVPLRSVVPLDSNLLFLRLSHRFGSGVGCAAKAVLRGRPPAQSPLRTAASTALHSRDSDLNCCATVIRRNLCGHIERPALVARDDAFPLGTRHVRPL